MAPSRDRRTSRHRAPALAPKPAVAPRRPDGLAADGELDSYLAALGADPDQPTGGFGTAQVFQLRLTALRLEQLRRIARDRGVSPGALAVDWVIERLDHEDTPTGSFAVVEEAEKRRGGPLGRLRRRPS